MKPLGYPAALMLVRRMSCLPRYPGPAGESRMAEVLVEVAKTVEHAKAIVDFFEERFPTIRELRDVALSLRSSFELVPNPIERLKQEYKDYVAGVLQSGDTEELAYCESQHPEIVQEVRAALRKGLSVVGGRSAS